MFLNMTNMHINGGGDIIGRGHVEGYRARRARSAVAGGDRAYVYVIRNTRTETGDPTADTGSPAKV